MSGRITNAIVSFIELLEAEGREFRTQAQRTLHSAAYFFIGLLFLCAAIFAFAAAIYVILARFISFAGASFVIAVLLGLCALFFLKKSETLSFQNKQNASLEHNTLQDKNNAHVK